MPSNDCITFYRCLLKGEVIEPALGDAHCKAASGDSPDLPAGPALALQLALTAQTGQPAAVIMDAESTESGDILSAGLHDGHAALVVSSAVPVLASSSLPSASVQTPADIATQKVAGATDVPCFLGGGRLTYEDSLAAHGYQRKRLKCTFHASCFKSRRLHFRSPQPTAAAQRDWLLTNSDEKEPTRPACLDKQITVASRDATRFWTFFVSARPCNGPTRPSWYRKTT